MHIVHATSLTRTTGIEYFHQCRDAVDADASVDINEDLDDNGGHHNDVTVSKPTHDDANMTPIAEPVMTLNQIEEDLHGRMAVKTGRYLGLLPNQTATWEVTCQDSIGVGDSRTYSQLKLWRQQLQEDGAKLNLSEDPSLPNESASIGRKGPNQPPSVTVLAEESNTPHLGSGVDADMSAHDTSSITDSTTKTLNINDEHVT